MKDIVYGLLAAWGQSWDYEQVRANGERLGRLLWRLLPERRKLATEAIAAHLDLPRERAEALALESFQHSGRSFLEVFQIRRVDERFVHERLTIADPELFQAFRDSDRPCVAISGHMGAWELMPGLCTRLVPERRALVVVRRPKDQALHETVTHLRTRSAVSIVEHRQTAPKVLRALKKRDIAAFLVDHNTGTSEAVFLPFLKKIAAVNMGPALLAIRGQAVIQPLFLLRERDGGYVLHTQPALDTRELTGSREEKIKKAALFYTQAVERVVRAHPEQWYWLHKRWKTQPEPGWTWEPPET